jgi:hypothetical protein
VIHAVGPVAGSGSNRSGDRRFTGAFADFFAAVFAVVVVRFAFSITWRLLQGFAVFWCHAL